MNKKGFTLIELLGVIIILSIVMLIAIPNITSVLSKNKKDSFIADAKKLITQAEYEIRVGEVEKPASDQLVKIMLSYLGTKDVSKDPDGNTYNTADSYVIVVRKDGYLEYYVNLVSTNNGKNKGIYLVHDEELNSDVRRSLVKDDVKIPTTNDIYEVTGVSGTIISY